MRIKYFVIHILAKNGYDEIKNSGGDFWIVRIIGRKNAPEIEKLR